MSIRALKIATPLLQLRWYIPTSTALVGYEWEIEGKAYAGDESGIGDDAAETIGYAEGVAFEGGEGAGEICGLGGEDYGGGVDWRRHL